MPEPYQASTAPGWPCLNTWVVRKQTTAINPKDLPYLSFLVITQKITQQVPKPILRFKIKVQYNLQLSLL